MRRRRLGVGTGLLLTGLMFSAINSSNESDRANRAERERRRLARIRQQERNQRERDRVARINANLETLALAESDDVKERLCLAILRDTKSRENAFKDAHEILVTVYKSKRNTLVEQEGPVLENDVYKKKIKQHLNTLIEHGWDDSYSFRHQLMTFHLELGEFEDAINIAIAIKDANDRGISIDALEVIINHSANTDAFINAYVQLEKIAPEHISPQHRQKYATQRDQIIRENRDTLNLILAKPKNTYAEVLVVHKALIELRTKMPQYPFMAELKAEANRAFNTTKPCDVLTMHANALKQVVMMIADSYTRSTTSFLPSKKLKCSALMQAAEVALKHFGGVVVNVIDFITYKQKNQASILDCLTYGRWGRSDLGVESMRTFFKMISHGANEDLGLHVERALSVHIAQTHYDTDEKMVKAVGSARLSASV